MLLNSCLLKPISDADVLYHSFKPAKFNLLLYYSWSLFRQINNATYFVRDFLTIPQSTRDPKDCKIYDHCSEAGHKW